MPALFWDRRFAAAYIATAVALLVLVTSVDSSIDIVTPLVLGVAGLGIVVAASNRKAWR